MSKLRTPSILSRAALSAALAFLLLAAVSISGCGGRTADTSQINLGTPPGTSLILAKYVAANIGKLNDGTPELQVSTFPDCCSANIQLALSSLAIDAALMCPDSAAALIARDSRFFIVGPCLANSDVMVIRGDTAAAAKIGVSQEHLYQDTIVSLILGPGRITSPMLVSALSPAYEKGDVDGVVMDIEGAMLLQGTMLCTGGSRDDVVTYDLVARKDLPGLDNLKKAFSTAVTGLSDPLKLQSAIAAYGQFPSNGQEAALWVKENIRFLILK